MSVLGHATFRELGALLSAQGLRLARLWPRLFETRGARELSVSLHSPVWTALGSPRPASRRWTGSLQPETGQQLVAAHPVQPPGLGLQPAHSAS